MAEPVREGRVRKRRGREGRIREGRGRDGRIREMRGREGRARGESRLDQPREPRTLRLPRPDQETFGRWAEAIARFMGTARFLVYMTVVIVAWIGWNTLGPPRLRIDPYTFTFLTLLLSLQASYAAPLILLAQNRQADRDRLALEEDRQRAALQKADTEYLSREIAGLRMALGEVATRDFLRSELNRLSEDLDEAAVRRRKLERNEHKRRSHRKQDADEVAAGDDARDRAPDSDLEEPVQSRPTKVRRAPQGARRATPSS